MRWSGGGRICSDRIACQECGAEGRRAIRPQLACLGPRSVTALGAKRRTGDIYDDGAAVNAFRWPIKKARHVVYGSPRSVWGVWGLDWGRQVTRRRRFYHVGGWSALFLLNWGQSWSTDPVKSQIEFNTT